VPAGYWCAVVRAAVVCAAVLSAAVLCATVRKYKYRPELSRAAKKHHTEGKVVAELAMAATALDAATPTPKSTKLVRLDTRNGSDTATK
jgi:hypothetical protein